MIKHMTLIEIIEQMQDGEVIQVVFDEDGQYYIVK